MLPRVSEFYAGLPLNEGLWKRIEAYSRSADAAQLTGARKRLLEETLADFRQNGADLPADKKARFKAISQELSQLTSNYSENVLDATNAWTKRIDDVAALAGLPDSAVELARHTAEQRGEDGWLLTLDYPSYMPVMTYCDNRELRRRGGRVAGLNYEQDTIDL